MDGKVGERPPPQWMVRLSSTRLSPAKLGNDASTQGSGNPDWLHGTHTPWVPSRGASSKGAKQENANEGCMVYKIFGGQGKKTKPPLPLTNPGGSVASGKVSSRRGGL